jgi:hypothetical protein
MVVPVAGRAVAAAFGAVLVIVVWHSVIGTVIVPRPVSTWLTRVVDRSVGKSFRFAHRFADGDFRRWDRWLSVVAPTILLGQLAAWLVIAFFGFTLLLWPFVHEGITYALTASGSSMFTLGFDVPESAVPAVIVFLGAVTGLVILTLQIAYLPTLYTSFNRRETEVALLNARAGVPCWGPELLARTHYALGSGVSTIDTLPDLYAAWERWAADVAESHTTYLPLVRFRSPRPLSSWVTALLAVLDSAALILSLSPEAAPTVPARLCLRSGFLCFNQIAQAMSLDVPAQPELDGVTTLTQQEFLDAVETMRKVDFPIERDPMDAWPDFVGWRVNYEQAAYAIAKAIDAVPALWSGPRKHKIDPIPPIRPLRGRPPTKPMAKTPAGPARKTVAKPAKTPLAKQQDA